MEPLRRMPSFESTPPSQHQHQNQNQNQSQKRQRAKHACEPCRLRKRKCDGEQPCNMCKQFEYKCYFEKHPRKRSKIVEQNAQRGEQLSAPRRESSTTVPSLLPENQLLPNEDQSNIEDAVKMKNMEANSGIAFTRLLGQRLDTTTTTTTNNGTSSNSRLFTFGWNLGTATYTPPSLKPITDFLDQSQMYFLAQLHFQTVHLIYGFLEKEWILEQINLRWAQPELCVVPDHLFANLAAVGSAFSRGRYGEGVPEMVEVAKKGLDSTSIMQTPTLLDIHSWILRSLYFRLTAHPHSCHMAASVTMHLVEALGLHQDAGSDSSSSVLHPREESTSDQQQSPHDNVEVRRRTFWVARMLNTFVSFEYGRSRVALRGITTQLPQARETDFTVEYIRLYSLSCALDPERSDTDSKWEDFLRQLDEYEAKHDAIELSRTNLGLCGYRRLRLATPNLSPETMNRVIRIGLRGVEAARRQCEQGMAWWHVGYVPFQAVCVFLAMDTRESLALVGKAIGVLEEVVEEFRTVAVKEALKMARFLVRLSKKRKEEDALILAESLKKESNAIGTAAANGGAEQQQFDDDDAQAKIGVQSQSTLPNGIASISVPMHESPATVSSGDEWAQDVLRNFPEFDWNFFLTADMPALDNFAPDGNM